MRPHARGFNPAFDATHRVPAGGLGVTFWSDGGTSPVATIDKLARYRDISPLGSGGTATVVLAEDTTLGRLVALKRVHASADPRGRSRVRREALVGASLSHPNLVSIYDVLGDADGDHVIVMEYVEGETLRDALRDRPGLPVADVLRIVDGVAAALDAIHQRGIVHRDVKPANILLGSNGAIKLADLGIASAIDRTRITTDGAVLGTFSYMAPEQLGGESPTRAVDIYALTAVAFEALCGRKARTELNPLALAHAISTQPPPNLRDVWPQAPAAAAEVLVRGMAREPSRRPSSAGELARRLRAALAVAAAGARLSADDVAGRPAAFPTGASARSSADDGTAQSGSFAAGAALTPVAWHRRRSRAPIFAAACIVLVAAAVAAALAISQSGSRHAARGAAASRGSSSRSAADRPQTTRTSGTLGSGADGTSAARGGSPQEGAALATAPPSSPASGATAGLGAASPAGTATRTAASSPDQSRATTPPTSKSPANHPSSATSSTPASNLTGGRAILPPAPSTTPSAATSPAGAPSASRSAKATDAGAVSAVESFYVLAAGHRYAEAWALADSTFRTQLGGYASFEAGQAGDRSITFHSAQVLSRSSAGATVAVRTTSVRTDGTHHCSGTVELVPGSTGTWLLHLIHINCS